MTTEPDSTEVALAVDHLSFGRENDAIAIFRSIQDRGISARDLRTVVLRESKRAGVTSAVVARTLAASRRPGPPAYFPGSPDDIPHCWRTHREVGYITPQSNLESILELGILCHNRAETIVHDSVSDEGIQPSHGRFQLFRSNQTAVGDRTGLDLSDEPKLSGRGTHLFTRRRAIPRKTRQQSGEP